MNIRVKKDMSGMGTTWLVYTLDHPDYERVLLWSHSALEGPKPTFESLWDVLEKWQGKEPKKKKDEDWSAILNAVDDEQ